MLFDILLKRLELTQSKELESRLCSRAIRCVINPILSRSLKQFSVMDYTVALTTLTYKTPNQTHYYRCTAHALSIPLCFLLFPLAVSRCFGPPAHQSWEWLDQTSACLLLTAQTQENTKRHNARRITHAAAHTGWDNVHTPHVYTHTHARTLLHNEKGINIQWI